ncbi:hypothetical protein Bca52824_036231 [Brassica carinata]|uniref:non-specific serine/threonine protein kinase n=1 Tax=Brassica carinata TaxID=52824 RepID=A0A8X7V2G0_BRACI|nr:hypothetical protein Bca52824_036231 [Brassica carinata]
MESPCRISVVVLGTLAIIHLVLAQDQEGFISLDCGLPAEELSPYDERHTGLRFSSDATYIRSGKTGRIQANRESEFSKQYTTLRYFPNGTRNCYNLSVEKGRKYLVRATFVYGNYDGLNIKPKFDLYLGPNPWTTIDLQGDVDSGRVEMLHIPTSNSVQICLVKNGTTTPLISTVEIRPVGNDTYTTVSGSLNLLFRSYLNKSDTDIRYPSDIYDRVWLPYFQGEWTQISTTLQVNVSNNGYASPEAALTTAAIPTNSNSPLVINWTSSNVDNQYYLYTHFSEIQKLRTKDTREFNMTWNGEHYYGPLVPPKFHGFTVFSRSGESCKGGECSLQLTRTNRSTLPPLLNALEVYTVIQFPQSETDEIDVIAVQNIKTTYGISRISWQGDPCVPQQFMWDGLNCSNTDMSTPPTITHLNLSSSGLTGTITDGIQNLTLLETLDLSNNNLTGEVPEFLGNMKSLVFINISKNDLSGLIPQALQRKGLDLFSQGNPRLCLSGSCLPPKPKPFPVAIVASVASVAIIIIAVLVLTFVLRKKKPSIVGEVINMTNNFQKVVGEGGFGIVYHGTLNGCEQIAVKLLSQSSSQGYMQFKAEVDLLMRVHHTNLVNLVGYCNEGDHLALIYEFVLNGDVRQHLSGKGGRSIINWGIRLQIAVEAASGLEYLHIGCIPPIVHRDVKTTNILLDEQFKARLADFGLSRSFPVGDESHVSTMIAGTPGYLDPEYYRTNRLTEKSDVYSFGIVLLEMITNQPVIDQSREKSHITQWVEFEVNSGDIRSILDPNLQEDYDADSAWRILDLAMTCANPSSTRRPSMSQVVVELKECLASEKSRRNMRRGKMDSHSSAEVSLLVDTGMYPSDIYDRVWLPYFQGEWTQISTTLQVNVSNNGYASPEAALTTAAIPTNSNSPLVINWTSSNVDNQYYLYTHFSEIQKLRTKDTREFNMTWNGEHYYGPLVPPKFHGFTVFSRSGESCKGGECSLQLTRTNRSTLPPLLNALEVYTVIQFPQSETDEIDVIAVQNIKTTYGISRISWQGDPCVPQQFMWDGLNCSNTDMSTPPTITHLNLSSSGLTGTITDGIQNLTLLETLDLSNNNLTGEVPENISKNDLSGLIPQALQRKGLDLFSQGNPRLCLSGSCLPPKPKPFPVAIVASVASVAIIIIAVLVLTFVLRKKSPQERQPSTSSLNATYTNSPVSSIQTNKRSFTYSEVINMTNNFQKVVGEGGFGIVYHGTLNGCEQIAVKLLSQSSSQGYMQFKAEVDLLMRVHHTNLVNLVGYCNEGDHLALIYEFVLNGDVRQHLSGKGGRSIINWGIRLQIAVEAASGLEYLHIGCIPPIVHRDVKTTNILLDEQFKARLADFGLSRSFPVGDESHVSTMIAGTPGYLDPEYYRTNRLTEKSDVYSFGIVLLEMITNQPVIDQSREKSHITQWVEFEVNSGDIRSILDPNLQEDYDADSAWRILDLAMTCANPSSTRRPSMSQVVVELKECLASEKSRRNMRRGKMDSHSSAEVSLLVDTGMFPVAR